MKNKIACVLFLAGIPLASCRFTSQPDNGSKKNSRPGTVIASSTMPVTEDQLNHFTCSIKIIADSNVADGVYDVDADYGPNFAEGQFKMPDGAGKYSLLIKNGPKPCSFIIGFMLEGDTAFYEYYQVECSKATTRMQYIKAYTF